MGASASYLKAKADAFRMHARSKEQPSIDLATQIQNQEKAIESIGKSLKSIKLILYNNTPLSFVLSDFNISEGVVWLVSPPVKLEPGFCSVFGAVVKEGYWDEKWSFSGKLVYNGVLPKVHILTKEEQRRAKKIERKRTKKLQKQARKEAKRGQSNESAATTNIMPQSTSENKRPRFKRKERLNGNSSIDTDGTSDANDATDSLKESVESQSGSEIIYDSGTKARIQVTNIISSEINDQGSDESDSNIPPRFKPNKENKENQVSALPSTSHVSSSDPLPSNSQKSPESKIKPISINNEPTSSNSSPVQSTQDEISANQNQPAKTETKHRLPRVIMDLLKRKRDSKSIQSGNDQTSSSLAASDDVENVSPRRSSAASVPDPNNIPTLTISWDMSGGECVYEERSRLVSVALSEMDDHSSSHAALLIEIKERDQFNPSELSEATLGDSSHESQRIRNPALTNTEPLSAHSLESENNADLTLSDKSIASIDPVTKLVNMRRQLSAAYLRSAATLQKVDLERLESLSYFDIAEIRELHVLFSRVSGYTPYITTDTFDTFMPELSDPELRRAIFAGFDKSHEFDYRISFDEFVLALSSMCRGTLEEKAVVVFNMCSSNVMALSGAQTPPTTITREQVLSVVSRISSAMESAGFTTRDYGDPRQVVNNIFLKQSHSTTRQDGIGKFHNVIVPKFTMVAKELRDIKHRHKDEKESRSHSVTSQKNEEAGTEQSEDEQDNFLSGEDGSLSEDEATTPRKHEKTMKRKDKSSLEPNQDNTEACIASSVSKAIQQASSITQAYRRSIKKVDFDLSSSDESSSSSRLERSDNDATSSKNDQSDIASSSSSKNYHSDAASSSSSSNLQAISNSIGSSRSPRNSPSFIDKQSIPPKSGSPYPIPKNGHPRLRQSPYISRYEESLSKRQFRSRCRNEPDIAECFGLFDFFNYTVVEPISKLSQEKSSWQRISIAGYLCKERGSLSRRLSSRRDRRYFLLKDGFFGYSKKPGAPLLRVIPLWEASIKPCISDRKFSIFAPYFSRKLQSTTVEEAQLWVHSIRSTLKGKNRFKSFAPPREDISVRPLVNGKEYFNALLPILQKTKRRIFIGGWYLSPGLLLKRGAMEGINNFRLDHVLLDAANRGVMIYIIIYNAPSLSSFDLQPAYVATFFNNLHPNIHCITHPNNTVPSMWSHHQKLVVCDETVAFIGGIDLCYGRYDDSEYRLTDDDEINFPGRDYCNVFIENESNGPSAQSIIDRKTQCRMPWADVQVQVNGMAALDIGLNFIQRWCHIVREGTYECKKMPYVFPSHSVIDVEQRFGTIDAKTGMPFKSTENSDYYEETSTQLSSFGEDGSSAAGSSYQSTGLASGLTAAIASGIVSGSAPGSLKKRPVDSDQLSDSISSENGSHKFSGSRRGSSRRDLKPMPVLSEVEPIAPSGILFQASTLAKEILEQPEQVEQKLSQESALLELTAHPEDLVASADSNQPVVIVPEIPWDSRVPFDNLSLDQEEMGFSGCKVQIVRSVSGWSAGVSAPEQSIYKAYVSLIREAKHFIYIQNQYFISSIDKSSPKNRLLDALYCRIKLAIESQEAFRVLIILPVFPGGGSLETPATRYMLKYTYRGIERGGSSLYEKLEKDFPNVNIKDYVSFATPRQIGRLGDTLASEQVYIHAKVMIVDDAKAIIGSANINDRSLRGTRDSEIAAVIEAGKPESIQTIMMNGKPFDACIPVHQLRLRMWADMLGIKETIRPVEIDDQTSSLDCIRDPIMGFNLMLERAKENTKWYLRIFPSSIPDTLYRVSEFKPARVDVGPNEDPVVREQRLEDAAKIKGIITAWPHHFLKDEPMRISVFEKEYIVPRMVFL